MFSKAAGTLVCRGSLSPKKWEQFYIIVTDGTLQQWSTGGAALKEKTKSTKQLTPVPSGLTGDRGQLLALFPLTNGSLVPVGKKEKTHTNFAFAIGGLGGAKEKDKWHTIFCADSAAQMEKFVTAIQASLYLSKRNIFGTTVRDACLKSNKIIPDIMLLTINRLTPHVKTEGLFRVNGDQELIQKASDLFDRGEIPVELIEKSDVHLSSGLLKSYLRGLAEPIIPFSLYKEFAAIVALPADKQVEALTKAITLLPQENTYVLHYLIKFLTLVVAEAEHNKMDAKNLGVVFGPNIMRSETAPDPNAEKGTPSKELVASAANQNTLFQMMIDNFKLVFPPLEESFFSSQISDPTVELVKLCRRRYMTTTETPLIEAVLKTHIDCLPCAEEQWNFTSGWLSNVLRVGTKQAALDLRIVIIDHHRIYFFLPGGKCETEVHLNDLTELISPHPFQLQISWQSPKEKTSTTLLVTPISYVDHVVDAILEKLFREYQRNYVGRNFRDLKCEIEGRFNYLLDRTKIEDPIRACGGLLWTYVTLCDHYPLIANPNVVADIEDYFFKNNIVDIYLEDFLSPTTREKFSSPEFEVFAFALRHNIWFKSLTCDNNNLTNDGLAFIAKIFEMNATITSLSLKNTGGKSAGLQCLIDAFEKNQNLVLTDLSLAGNTLDSAQSCGTFARCLGSCLKHLQRLDISNVQMYKHGWNSFFSALNQTPSLCTTLTDLDISNNRLVDKVADELGKFLAATKALTNLNLSAVSVSFGVVNLAMSNASCGSIKKLDISKYKSKNPQAQGDLVAFILKLPGVIDLNISQTEIHPMGYTKICTKTLVSLDVSDTDLSEILAPLCDHLIAQRPIDLVNLSMNRCVFSHSARKSRSAAIQAVSNLLASVPISSFNMKGSSKSALKTDLVDIVLGLLNNNTLRHLDVSGHQAGDKFANAISKCLQHNHTLDSLLLDGNAISVRGLRLYKMGFERNGNIKHFPLPLTDIAKLHKADDQTSSLTGKSAVNADMLAGVRDMCIKIQKIVTENAITFDTSHVQILDAEEAEMDDMIVWSRQRAPTKSSISAKRERRRDIVGRKRRPEVNPLTLTLKPDMMVPRASGYGTVRASRLNTSRLSLGGFDAMGNLPEGSEDFSDLGNEVSSLAFSPTGTKRHESKRQLSTSLFSVATDGSSDSHHDDTKSVSDTTSREGRRDPTPSTPDWDPRRIKKRMGTVSSDKRSSNSTPTKLKSSHPPKPAIVGVDLFAALSNLDKPEVDEIRRKTRQWNTEFQTLYDQEISVDKYIKLQKLINNFKQVTQDISRIIVAELHSVFRTLEPIARNDYHCQGISFRVSQDFRVDEKFYYGDSSRNDICSIKTLSQHMRGSRFCFDLLETKSQNNIRLPLVSLTHYKGFVVVATALLPLIQEASKPAQNILDVVKSVGASLNLAPFSPTQEGPAVYGPELSLSTAVDNRTYYMDLSTFMPPEYPTYKEGELQHFPEQQSVFYSSFRPNFVKKYPEPLCSYGLTAAIQNDPNKDHHNNLLRNATNHLFDVVIPGFAAEMDQEPVPSNLMTVIHAWGINARHLGRVRRCMKSTAWHSALLEECCFRTLKNLICASVRQGDGSNASKFSTVDFINSLLVGSVHEPIFKLKSPGSPNQLTFDNHGLTASSPCQIIGGDIPKDATTVYFELTITSISMEPIQICVLNDEQTEKQEFGLGISVSEKNRIGVLINRKCSMIQYFIGDVLAGASPIIDHSKRLFPVISVGGSVTLTHNFGPEAFFEFPILSFCERLCLPPPVLPSYYSSLFWAVPHNGEFQKSFKSFKNYLISYFPFSLTEEENAQTFDLRSSIKGHRLVKKAIEAVGLTISQEFKNILTNELNQSISASDILGSEPITKTLFSPFLDEVIALIASLQGKSQPPSGVNEKINSLEAKLSYATPLEEFFFSQSMFTLASVQKDQDRAATLSKALTHSITLETKLSGKLLRELYLLQGAILVLLGKSDTNEIDRSYKFNCNM